MSDLAFEDSFCAYYKKQKIEPTDAQMTICRQVADFHAHFTEDQLRQSARKEYPDLPAGIVKKTLSDMHHAGLIRKITFGEDKIFYEHVHGHLHHDHLWCLECNKVIEFHDERISDIQEQIARDNNFIILRHQLQLVGLCEDCKAKAAKYQIEKPKEQPREKMIPLSMAPDGSVVVIEQLLGGRRMRLRLSEMGLVKGETVRVVSNRFAGPFIIEVKGTRVGVAHGLAHHILVKMK